MNKMFTMKKTLILLVTSAFLFSFQRSAAQEIKRLTFEEVIKLSEDQSPQALIAKHRFRASYWQYRTYVAQYRPGLTLSGTTPDYSTAYTRVYTGGQWEYIPTNMLQNIGALSLAQNIGLTGGSISLESDLTLQNDFAATPNTRKYISVPVSVRLNQPIFRYNSLKWQKKIAPLQYATAKKTFLSNIEGVHQMAVQYFFMLAQAQINKQIAVMNLSNADTLYRIADGRYKLGTIAEDDLLQMQLSYLNAETARKQADMNLRDREIRLRSFLGFNDQVRLELIIPDVIPTLQVDVQEVNDLAMANNPDIMNQQLTLLTAQSSVAQAKAEKGLNANLVASFGLQGKDADFTTAYTTLNRNQGVRIGFTLPILDWGLGRGKYKMAQSSLELAQVQQQQALIDFQQNLYLDVEQFNLQKDQVAIAAKSDTVAARMYEVTKQRFLIGKIAILDLNNADTKKDQNKRAYLQELQNYWDYFYNIRTLTLYDFINKKPLETDYENLLQ
jgi:outer membrane protein TolC